MWHPQLTPAAALNHAEDDAPGSNFEARMRRARRRASSPAAARQRACIRAALQRAHGRQHERDDGARRRYDASRDDCGCVSVDGDARMPADA
jgi:hypothetical protein